MKSIIELRAAIDREPARSAWTRGVKEYTQELLDDLTEGRGLKNLNDRVEPITEKELLNGAKDWNQFSWGGCSLAYDHQIARRLCSPSELKKTEDGARKPNAREEWLDVQARALCQAAAKLIRLAMA